MGRLASIIAVFNLFTLLLSSASGNRVGRNARIDCAPGTTPGITRRECKARGCIWDTAEQKNPANNAPVCYFPTETGFSLDDGATSADGSLTLQRLDGGAKNPYGKDFPRLSVKPRSMGSALSVEITPVGEQRYIPPVPLNTDAHIDSSEELLFKSQENASQRSFSFTVERKSDGCRLWDTSIGGLLFSDQYIQVGWIITNFSYLPTDKIYGIGEHLHRTLKHNFTNYNTWALFTRGDPPQASGPLGLNLYGVHPFYLALETSGKAHGVLIFNSNAQDITMGPAPHLIYRTIGGQLNLYFFPGPTPEQVIQQYAQLIGKPFLPPYWALGYQFCRYGYKSVDDMKNTIGRIRDAKIPIDVAYADIDYMDQYKDFTISKENWAGLPSYTNQLHEWGMRLILIFDPAIAVTYASFERALAMNASFIEWPTQEMVPREIQNLYPLAKDTKIMLGVVWPDNHTAFPDFLDPTGKTAQWWGEELSRFHQEIPYDGVWIDMNEPYNVGTNGLNPWYQGILRNSPLPRLICPGQNDPVYSHMEFPPYVTASSYLQGGQPLFTDTLCLSGVSSRGSNHLYNTHSIYGWAETVTSQAALVKIVGKRAPVISRSTFPSSGQYGGHWLGDNSATWADLKDAIISVQEFNLFGIPYVGSDVCGFGSQTTEELCLRWQQLGAFHSFFRNHNANNQPDHDPPRWPSVALATRVANLFRYELLPYLYSLHFSVSLLGGTVQRPVFFEFPSDAVTHELDYQFMWGPSIIVIPVIYPNVTSVQGYLPPATRWYSISEAHKYGEQIAGGQSTFSAPRDTPLPTFVRAGRIIPKQKPGLTTAESRNNEFRLLVALDLDKSGIGTASGELYWDDGESLLKADSYYHFVFSAAMRPENASIKIQCEKMPKVPINLPVLDTIEVLGHAYRPDMSSVHLLQPNGEHSQIGLSENDSLYDERRKYLKLHSSSLVNLTDGTHSWTITWENLPSLTV